MQRNPSPEATGHVKFSIRGFKVLTEPSELSGTPGCSRWELGLMLMAMLACKVDDSSIMNQQCHKASWYSKKQGLISLRLHLPSFLKHTDDDVERTLDYQCGR
jgi:hypothetical protein